MFLSFSAASFCLWLNGCFLDSCSRYSISGISNVMSERIHQLVSRFNSRTERFKEKTIQPLTPSTNGSVDTKSGELPICHVVSCLPHLLWVAYLSCCELPTCPASYLPVPLWVLYLSCSELLLSGRSGLSLTVCSLLMLSAISVVSGPELDTPTQRRLDSFMPLSRNSGEDEQSKERYIGWGKCKIKLPAILCRLLLGTVDPTGKWTPLVSHDRGQHLSQTRKGCMGKWGAVFLSLWQVSCTWPGCVQSPLPICTMRLLWHWELPSSLLPTFTKCWPGDKKRNWCVTHWHLTLVTPSLMATRRPTPTVTLPLMTSSVATRQSYSHTIKLFTIWVTSMMATGCTGGYVIISAICSTCWTS